MKLVECGRLTDAYSLSAEINGLCDDDDERNLTDDEVETFIGVFLKERLQDDCSTSYVKCSDDVRQSFIVETMSKVCTCIFN